MTRLLLAHGANVRLKDNNGNTALHAVARHCAKPEGPELFSLLLKHGAQPNARAGKGETVLHLAARALNDSVGGIDGVRMPLDWGADPALRDESLRLPLDYRPQSAEALELLQPPPQEGQPQLKRRTSLRGAGKSGGRRRTTSREIDVEAEYGDLS